MTMDHALQGGPKRGARPSRRRTRFALVEFRTGAGIVCRLQILITLLLFLSCQTTEPGVRSADLVDWDEVGADGQPSNQNRHAIESYLRLDATLVGLKIVGMRHPLNDLGMFSRGEVEVAFAPQDSLDGRASASALVEHRESWRVAMFERYLDGAVVDSAIDFSTALACIDRSLARPEVSANRFVPIWVGPDTKRAGPSRPACPAATTCVVVLSHYPTGAREDRRASVCVTSELDSAFHEWELFWPDNEE